MFLLQVISVSGAESPEVNQNPPTCAPQVSTVEQGSGDSQVSMNPVQVSTPVSSNVFMGTTQGTHSFTTAQIKVLAEDRYDTQEAVLYLEI